jgi:hypothetical protein
MTSECEKLDAYLADDLSADAAIRFTNHLNQCATCRDAVDEQRWIDQVLRSHELAIIEPAPPALHETFRISIARRRQRTRLIACGLATAAATIAVAMGWTLKLNGPAIATRREAPSQITTHAGPAMPPRATFVSNGDTIAVPLECADENVTIVQLYPTTETERRMRRELALQILFSESNGG